jgi:hypothetical protein
MIRATIICFAIAVASNTALAQNYGAWAGWSDEYKRGFSLALMMHMALSCDFKTDPDCKTTSYYNKCLQSVSDEAATKLVDKFVERNPAVMKQSMLGIVLQTLHELCGDPPTSSGAR